MYRKVSACANGCSKQHVKGVYEENVDCRKQIVWDMDPVLMVLFSLHSAVPVKSTRLVVL